MITELRDDPIQLTKDIANLSIVPSWKYEGITINGLDNLIRNNLRLILEQTENPNTSPQLHESLQALQTRISKESDTPEARELAFNIMGYARGLYDAGPKLYWDDLINDQLRYGVFQNIVPRGKACNVIDDYGFTRKTINSGLLNVATVSKNWKELALEAKKLWCSQEAISLRTFGCKNGKEAVQYILDNKLLNAIDPNANLLDFDDLTVDDLQKLTKNYPNIRQLHVEFATFKYDIIDEVGKKFIQVSNLTSLTSLSILSYQGVNEDHLSEALPTLTNLTSLRIKDVDDIKGHKLAKALAKFSKLTSLDLSWCRCIEEEMFAEVLPQLPYLKKLILETNCRIEGNILARKLPVIPNLKSLNLSRCNYLKGYNLYTFFSKFPNLSSLILPQSSSEIDDVDLERSLLQLYKLKSLDLTCYKITGKCIAKVLPMLPNLTKLTLPKIGEAELKKALSNMTSLKSLKLSAYQEIGYITGMALIKLTSLTCLYITYGDIIKENSLVMALPRLKNLNSLNMSSCRFSDKLLLTLSKLSNLTCLILESCDLTEDMMSEAIPKLSALKILNIRNTSWITKAKTQEWQNKFPGINFISNSD